MAHNVYDLGDSVLLTARFGLNVTRLVERARAGATQLRVRDVTGYVGPDVISLHPGADNEETLTVSGVPATNLLPVAAALWYDHESAEDVMELTDPTTITLRVKSPDAVTVVYTYALAQLTRDALGKYSKTVTVNQVGTWFYRWEGTGTVVAASEGHFDVKRTEF